VPAGELGGIPFPSRRREAGAESAADLDYDWFVSVSPDFFGLFIGHSLVGREGFEPSTLGLRVPCSTS
jgi:hypothetical protein